MKNFRILALALTTIATFTACSNEDGTTVVNEEEVTTTITATFTPAAGGNAITLTSRDLDGDGPVAPVVTVSGNFTAGAAYTGTVTFLNEIVNPVVNTTLEIQEEAVDHQIFFQQTGLGIFTYADADANGHPIGLKFAYTAATTPANSLLTITLRHLPSKSGVNVPTGDITNAGGGTDAEVSFPVVVE